MDKIYRIDPNFMFTIDKFMFIGYDLSIEDDKFMFMMTRLLISGPLLMIVG